MRNWLVLIIGLFIGYTAAESLSNADAHGRESCECAELRTIRQILLGWGPPSVPPMPTPTGTPDGGPLE
jgi:hypothetical protein